MGLPRICPYLRGFGSNFLHFGARLLHILKSLLARENGIFFVMWPGWQELGNKYCWHLVVSFLNKSVWMKPSLSIETCISKNGTPHSFLFLIISCSELDMWVEFIEIFNDFFQIIDTTAPEKKYIFFLNEMFVDIELYYTKIHKNTSIVWY